MSRELACAILRLMGVAVIVSGVISFTTGAIQWLSARTLAQNVGGLEFTFGPQMQQMGIPVVLVPLSIMTIGWLLYMVAPQIARGVVETRDPSAERDGPPRVRGVFQR